MDIDKGKLYLVLYFVYLSVKRFQGSALSKLNIILASIDAIYSKQKTQRFLVKLKGENKHIQIVNN